MGTQEIIEKVQKLRALSQSSNLNEAATAASLAEKLIAQYRLSEAELSAEKKISEPLIEAQQYLYETGRVIPWKHQLALRLSQHYGVYVYNSIEYSSTNRKRSRYSMVGRESDIQILQYNFEYLVGEITRIANYCVESSSRGASVERNSFCEGAVDGIMQKLRQEKKNIEAHATSAALIILNSKQAEAEVFAKQNNKITPDKSKSYRHHDAAAYEQGKLVGGSIRINSGLNPGSPTKLLKA